MPSSSTADHKPGFCRRFWAEVQRLAVVAVVVALLGISAKYYGFDRLNEEIRSRVETTLRQHYQGLSVSVRAARRVPGQGVEIRGIRIAEAGGKTAAVIAEIDELFAECDTRLPDFLMKPPQFGSLRIQRLRLRAERLQA